MQELLLNPATEPDRTRCLPVEALGEGERIEAGVLALHLVVADVKSHRKLGCDANLRATAHLTTEEHVALAMRNTAGSELRRGRSQAANLRPLQERIQRGSEG